MHTDSITLLSASLREALTMADISTSGLDELFDDLAAIAELPDEIALEMLRAEAEVVAEAQATEAVAMGVMDTGTTVRSITYGKKLTVRDGERVLYVYPNGTRKDHGGKRRTAEVAYVNEYGKHNQPARPFIRTANEKAADSALQAAARVYDEYLKSKNL